MKKEDLTIYEYRMGKEIENNEYVKNEIINGKYQKVTIPTSKWGYIDCYIYRPCNWDEKEELNVVFNFHGGGMVLGFCHQDGIYCQYIAEQSHVAVVNVDYLLAPEFKYPQGIQSSYEVVEYLCLHSADYHFKSNGCILMGHSAGGYLSTAITVMNLEKKHIQINGVIQDYALYKQQLDPNSRVTIDKNRVISTDRMSQYLHWYFDDLSRIDEPCASPLNANLKGFPPVCIITAEYDSLYAEANDFKNKVLKENVETEFYMFEGCEHGFTHKWLKEYNPECAKEAWLIMTNFISKKVDIEVKNEKNNCKS